MAFSDRADNIQAPLREWLKGEPIGSMHPTIILDQQHTSQLD
jgi:hypothetical protein